MRSLRIRLYSVKYALLVAWFFLEIVFYSTWAVRFWVERRLGREAQVKATIRGMVEGWAHRLLRRIGCHMEVEGRENVPPTGPLVVMTNHQSMYDILIFICQIRGMMGFVTKRELFRIPFFSFWMRQVGCVALDRSDPRSALALYERLSTELVQKGAGFIIFPEGTRTRDPGGAIGPFKEGSLRLATIKGLPVLPVAMDGSRFLTRPEAMFDTRRGGRLVRIKIGPVIPGKAETAPQRKALMAHIHDTIATNFASIRVTWPAAQAAPAADSPAGAKRAIS